MPESELQALLSISQIDLSQDLNQTLEEILTIVTKEVGGVSGTVMLLNEATGALEMVAAFGLGDDYIDRVYGRGVPIVCSPSGTVLKTGTYYEVPNIFAEPRDKWWADLGRELGFSAQLFMPMKRDKEVIGLLNIYMQDPHHYTHEEIAFVSIAASHAAVVIEKARLYQHVLEKRKELETEIKARQHAEETLVEKERQLNQIFALSPLGVGLVDYNPKAVYDQTFSWTNKAMATLFGFESGKFEYLGQSSEVLYASREEFERVGVVLKEKVKKGELVEVDAKLKRRDGSLFDGHLTLCFFDPSNPQKGLLATISDITRRKQAEELLSASEEKFRTFMETASDLMFIADKGGNFTYVNKAMATTLGYSKDELLEMNITQILTTQTVSEHFESRHNTVVAQGRLTLDAVWVTKAGREIHGELKIVAIYDADGRFTGKRCIFHDITERKRMEEELQRSEGLYKTLFEATSAPTVILDEDGTFYRVNEEGAKISGFTKEELEGKKKWTEFIATEEDLEKMKEIHRLRRTDPDNVPRNYEFLFKDRYGNLRNIFVTADVIPGTKRSLVSFADLTARLTAEESLRASEERYRSLIETAGAGVITLNMGGEFTLVNDAFCEMSGYSQEELLGRLFIDLLHPADRVKIRDIFLHALKGQLESPLFEFRVFHKDGRTLWWYTNPTPLICHNELRGFTAVIQDITERKRAEVAMQESEIYHRSLIENASDGIMLLNGDGIIQYQSPSAELILGYSQESRIGKSVFEYGHPDERAEITAAFRHLVERKGATQNLVLRLRHRDGSWRSIDGVAKNLLHDPVVHGIVINYRDVTAKQHAEEALQLKNFVIESSYNAIAIADLDGNLTYVNPAFLSLWGYDRAQEVLGRSAVDFWETKHKAAEVMRLVANGKSDAEQWTGELRGRRKDGSVFDALVTAATVYDPLGQAVGMAASFIDLTERKRAETALRESEEKYRVLIEHAQEGIVVAQDGFLKYANPNLKKYLGYSKEKLMAQPFSEFIHPDDRELVMTYYAKRLRGAEVPSHYPCRVINSEGTVLWAEFRAVIITWEARPATLTFITNITDRKEAEDRLRAKEHEQQTILDSVPSGIFHLDADGTYVHVNKTLAERYGRTPEDFIGKSTRALFPDDADAYIKNDCAVIMSGRPQLGALAKVHTTEGERWVRLDKVPLKDAAGNVSGIIGSELDVTAQKRVQQALAASEEKYRTLVENMQDGIFILQGHPPRLVFCNEAFAKMVGYTVEEAMTLEFKDYLAPEDLARVTDNYLRRQAGEDVPSEYEYHALHKDGATRICVNMNVGLVEYNGEVASLGTVKDITERKKMEEILKDSEQKLAQIVQGSSIPSFVIDNNHNITHWNTACERLTGVPAAEILGTTKQWSVFYLEKRPTMADLVVDNQSEEVLTSMYGKTSRKSDLVAGAYEGLDFFPSFGDTGKWLFFTAAPLTDVHGCTIGALETLLDFTELKHAEEQIKHSLKEKEVLLQEIHHRVKNNMQVISSLLNLTARRFKSKEDLLLLTDTQARVKSMALVHEKLYRSGDIALIDFADYIQGLTTNLLDAYSMNANDIALTLDVHDIFLDINAAVPCGLLVNELIANALKHAFPAGKKGKITVCMRPRDGDEIELAVSDTGVGFPEAMDFRNTDSLGLQLIVSLVEGQLDGSIELDRRDGTTFTIRFRKGTDEVV